MRTYIYALAVLCLVLVGHLLGLSGYYLKYFAYDVLMHILGGLGMGLFTLALIRSKLPNLGHKSLIVIICVFIFGTIWESLEIYYGIAGYPVGTKLYYFDTIKDLIDDIIGGTLVVYLYRNSLKLENTSS